MLPILCFQKASSTIEDNEICHKSFLCFLLLSSSLKILGSFNVQAFTRCISCMCFNTEVEIMSRVRNEFGICSLKVKSMSWWVVPSRSGINCQMFFVFFSLPLTGHHSSTKHFMSIVNLVKPGEPLISIPIASTSMAFKTLSKSR